MTIAPRKAGSTQAQPGQLVRVSLHVTLSKGQTIDSTNVCADLPRLHGPDPKATATTHMPKHRQDSPIDRTLHHAKLTLCSDLVAVEALDDIGRSFACLASFSNEESVAIGLAVREAAANAVNHGNRLDSPKTVAVEFRTQRRS